jgi:hypothetical protein
MRFFSSLFGFALFLFMVVGYFHITAVSIQHLNLFLFFFLVCGILGTSILAHGVKDTAAALYGSRFFLFTPQAPGDTKKNIRVVRYMIISCYGLGGLLFVIEVLSAIQIALIPELPERAVLKATISAVCSLLAPLVISEAFLRPLKARLETLAGK